MHKAPGGCRPPALSAYHRRTRGLSGAAFVGKALRRSSAYWRRTWPLRFSSHWQAAPSCWAEQLPWLAEHAQVRAEVPEAAGITHDQLWGAAAGIGEIAGEEAAEGAVPEGAGDAEAEVVAAGAGAMGAVAAGADPSVQLAGRLGLSAGMIWRAANRYCPAVQPGCATRSPPAAAWQSAYPAFTSAPEWQKRP